MRSAFKNHALAWQRFFFHKLKMETARSQKNDHQDQKCGIDVTPRYSFGHAFFFPLIMHFFEIGCGDFNARLCLASSKLRLHFLRPCGSSQGTLWPQNWLKIKARIKYFLISFYLKIALQKVVYHQKNRLYLAFISSLVGNGSLRLLITDHPPRWTLRIAVEKMASLGFQGVSSFVLIKGQWHITNRNLVCSTF